MSDENDDCINYEELLRPSKGRKVPKSFLDQSSRDSGRKEESVMDAYFNVLSRENAVCQTKISKGLWIPELDLVKVFQLRGNSFRTMGGPLKGFSGKTASNVFLEPEEALFLVERGSLALYASASAADLSDLDAAPADNSLIMSVFDAWHTLVLDSRVTNMQNYLLYSFLKKSGHVVFPYRQLFALQRPQSLLRRFLSHVINFIEHVTNWFFRRKKAPPIELQTSFGVYSSFGQGEQRHFKKSNLGDPDYFVYAVPFKHASKFSVKSFCLNLSNHLRFPQVPVKLALVPVNLGGSARDIVWFNYRCSCSGRVSNISINNSTYTKRQYSI